MHVSVYMLCRIAAWIRVISKSYKTVLQGFFCWILISEEFTAPKSHKAIFPLLKCRRRLYSAPKEDGWVSAERGWGFQKGSELGGWMSKGEKVFLMTKCRPWGLYPPPPSDPLPTVWHPPSSTTAPCVTGVVNVEVCALLRSSGCMLKSKGERETN